MRIGRVHGTVTLGKRLDALPHGNLLLVEALDEHALAAASEGAAPASDESGAAPAHRQSPEPQSLVVFDRLNAGRGQLIAVSEGREATAPFIPNEKPIDAYNAAILDTIEYQP